MKKFMNCEKFLKEYRRDNAPSSIFSNPDKPGAQEETEQIAREAPESFWRSLTYQEQNDSSIVARKLRVWAKKRKIG
ncbi:MAG: hypothetical protein ACRC8Y_11715 [Chroococcales cyanobacterium]